MAKKKINNRSDVDWTWVDPHTIENCLNEKNWKRHPERQKRVIYASITRNGWVKPLVFNKKSNRLIDGHGRLEIALEKGIEEVPVLFGHWSPDQERELLATLDTVGQMAQIDSLALDSLTLEVATSVEKELEKGDQFANDIMKSVIDVNAWGKEQKLQSPTIKRRTALRRVGQRRVKVDSRKRVKPKDRKAHLSQIVESDATIFPTSNKYGIPNLLPSMLYNEPDILPTHTFDGREESHHTMAWYCYSTRSMFKTKPIGGFCSFYTDDYRFERMYSRPEMVIPLFNEWNFHAIVEPDFSTYWNWPLVARQWNVYRSRWATRNLQEQGIYVIPTIRRTKQPEEEAAWLYRTLPSPCPFIAINVGMRHTLTPKDRNQLGPIIGNCLEVAIKHTESTHVILYGGADLSKYVDGYLPKGPTYIKVQSYIAARHRNLDKKFRKGGKTTKVDTNLPDDYDELD